MLSSKYRKDSEEFGRTACFQTCAKLPFPKHRRVSCFRGFCLRDPEERLKSFPAATAAIPTVTDTVGFTNDRVGGCARVKNELQRRVGAAQRRQMHVGRILCKE